MLKYLYLYGLAIVFLLASTSIQAQEKIDFIYLLSGEAIEAKVHHIDGKFVEYTTVEQKEAQMLRFAKTEVERVKLADGTEIWYNLLPKTAEPEKETAAAPAEKKKKKKKRPVSAQKLIRQR